MLENSLLEDALAVVLTTVSTAEEARTLATLLLEESLAACVQIDSPVESHYRWKGQMQVDTEVRLVIKTTTARVATLLEMLGEHHPYEEPQLLVIPVTIASRGYARWVIEQTSRK